jgi:hypothetical protein
MRSRLPTPVLLCLLAVVVCAVVNPGNFGTIDTPRRLQAERWIRLGEPPVRPIDRASGFGIAGRQGVVHAWYGIGQSLVLAPFDMLVSAAAGPGLRRLGLDAEKQRQVSELLIAFLMQASLTAALLLLARALLAGLGFPPAAALAGALSLLLATTCLYYVQVAQENLLLLVLALTALVSIRRWETTGAARWAALAGAAGGFAVLVRLPSLLEAGVFAAFALAAGGNRARFLAAYLPPLAVGVLADRWYQWLRFGEWTSTYMGLLGRLARPAGAPASYPFSYPFAKGFFGAFVSSDKSVLLFDPLLLVVAVAAVWHWRSLHRRVRALLVSCALLLLLYVALYARYFGFGGDVAWGHRYLTLPVHLLALFAIPIAMSTRPRLPRAVWAVLAIAVALQALSTTMVANVEVTQRERGEPGSVVPNRVANLAAVIAGRVDTPRFAGVPAEWRSLAYFPFQLRFHFPRLAVWAIAGWWLLVACIPLLVFRAMSHQPSAISHQLISRVARRL